MGSALGIHGGGRVRFDRPEVIARSSVPVTCVVLTLNEEVNLPSALASLSPGAQVVVVDSGSSDATTSIARSFDARVLENPWPGFAQQRNWALASPLIEHDWVLFVDADEELTEPGWQEVQSFLAAPADFRAADFRRSVYLFGRYLKHGGFGTARVTRLLHRRYCQFLERPVHEHAVVDGPILHMRVPMLHHDRKPFSAWLERHNRYSTLEAEARLAPVDASIIGGAASVKHLVRTRLWQRLPARPLLFFLYVYVLRLGFLDGRAGLRIASFYGFQELSVQVKMEEMVKRSAI